MTENFNITEAASDALGLSEDKRVWNEEHLGVTNNPSYDDGAWRKNLGYGFRVVNVINEIIQEDLPKDWLPFILQINPQSLNQSEIFAIQVTPTFRGVIVEHQGSVLKDITISGTTGISPGRQRGGAFSTTGKPILSAGRSGYEEFNELRSYFRAYVEQKRLESNRENDSELRLIFDNFRDHESIYVEPQRFVMKRVAASPMQYNYEITMKGIGNTAFAPKELRSLDTILDIIDNVVSLLQDGIAFIEGAIDIINRIERFLETSIITPLTKLRNVALAIQGGSGTFGEAKDKFRSRMKGLHDDFDTNPSSTVTEEEAPATTEIFNETSTSRSAFTTSSGNRRISTLETFGVTAESLIALSVDVQRIADNFADSIGIDLTQYNNALGRTSTLVISQTDITNKEHAAIHGLALVNRGMNLLLSRREFFLNDIISENNKVSAMYGGNINLFIPGSTRVATVLGNDTIQIIAAREMNNVDRYRELIILNNLVSPYIASTSSIGVLSPGDQILIPQSKSTIGNLGVQKGTKEFNVTAGMNEAEKSLGVDIRLDENFDIAFNNIADYDVIAGMEVYKQAINLRILTEPKALKRHPSYGTNLVGRKLTTQALAEIRSKVFVAFNSDPRTEKVDFLEISVDTGNTINILASLKPVKVNQTVPIPITLNV